MSKIKTTKKSIFILTEGDTEEAYFSRIGEIVGIDTDWTYSVTVEVREIVDGSKTDPINMVKEAKKAKRGYDEVWVVFDKDRERDDENQKAIELADKSKIKVAFSSISFEHWLILHFERNTYAFHRSDCESRSTRANPIICACLETICAASRLKAPALYPTFKKGYSLLYDNLSERTIQAIENAAWLRNQYFPIASINVLNPYSDVDVLVCELLNLTRVEYSSIGRAFVFDGVNITVNNFTRNPDNISISIVLDNQSDTAFPINDNQLITLIDQQGNSYPYNHLNTFLLTPLSNHNLTLEFNVNAALTSARLRFETSATILFIDLI